MTVTQSTWTSEEGKVFTVYYGVGENDIYVDGAWKTTPSANIPELISAGQQPQGPVGSIVVGTAHTVVVAGHNHIFWPAEFVSGYNEYGALWGDAIPNTEGGTVLYVGSNGQLLPAHGS